MHRHNDSPGSITDVTGIEVGHHTDTRRPTGCTAVLARAGAVAGVDVRGAAPGTRETAVAARGGWMPPVARPAGWRNRVWAFPSPV